MQAVANALAVLVVPADQSGDEIERRLPDPLLESDRAERGNRDQADPVGRARDRREWPVVVRAQGDVGQADDEVPAVVEQQPSRVLNELGDPRLRVLRPALAELDPPLDPGEATLELLAEIVDDALGEVAQLRLGVKPDPQGAWPFPGWLLRSATVWLT